MLIYYWYIKNFPVRDGYGSRICRRRMPVEKKVSVGRYIQQIAHGVHYQGHVMIGRTKLDYELRFHVPIPHLGGMEPPSEDVTEFRRLFQLALKKEDKTIELNDEEFRFFFAMLVEFAVDFYFATQSKKLEGETLRGHASIGSYNFHPEARALLNDPKFDCKLAAA